MINRGIWRLIGRLAFNRITVLGQGRLPASGAVLYVATHRNGALDAAPYAMAVPRAVPLISAQLHRTWLGRFLFSGIAVARAKDRERGISVDNRQSIEQSITLLQRGGELLVMPEGTSTLGSRHLPFQRGAARIAHAAVSTGLSLTIIPLGVHYEDPTTWQSRVEVLVGEPVQARPGDDVAAIHLIIVQGLESVGANFASGEAQHNAEMLAYASTLDTKTAYALALKNFEQSTPESLAEIAQPMALLVQQNHLCLHQGVPLIPIVPWPLYALYWLALVPFVMGFCLLNAPALATGFIASRKLPDAPNVIAFWRMAAGLPAGLFWLLLLSMLIALAQGFTWVIVYWIISLLGIGAWYRFRKLTVALCNSLLHADTRPNLLHAYRELLKRIPYGNL